jgi:hypothetical protein
MRRRADRKLGDLELLILNVLWERGPSTVREVLEQLDVEPRPAMNEDGPTSTGLDCRSARSRGGCCAIWCRAPSAAHRRRWWFGFSTIRVCPTRS